MKDLDERDVACLPDAVQSSRMDVLTTEYMVKLLCEVSTQDKHTAVVRMKDAEIRQLKTKLCRLHSCIQSILEQLDESEDSGARRTEDTMLCLQSSQKTFTTNVLEAYQNQVDQYQRQVTELNEQLSRARVAEAARVQAVESQMQKPNGTRVVDRRGDEKAAAVHSNDSEGHALGLKSQDIQSGFERDAIKKGVTTSEQLKATGSLTPVCGRTGDFSKKQQVGDRKGQGTTVTVGQSPQEWGDGEKNAGFGDKPKRVTENRESRLVGEIETLRREKNAMQIENQSLNDFVAKLQYEQQLAEASEETLKRDKQQLIKRMKRMEEQISRVAVVCRHEYEQATETPLHVQHPTTDSGLSTTSGTRNSRRTATESTSKGTNQ